MSKNDYPYWRDGVIIYEIRLGKSRQIALANNVHEAEAIVDALNKEEKRRLA